MFGLKEQHIEAINRCFIQYPDIELVVIYGSRAKGNHKKGSDIDLTILGELNFSDLLKLENQLDDLLLPYKIDLSLKNNINEPDLIAHIERVGKIFFNRNKKQTLNQPPEDYKTILNKE